jgi:hypothetical protein
VSPILAGRGATPATSAEGKTTRAEALHEKQHLRRVGVIQRSIIRQGRVAGAVEDGHHRLDELLEGVGCFWVVGQLGKQRLDCIDLLLSQQPQNLVNQLAAVSLRIAPLLPVGQVGIAGLLPRRPRRCGVAGGGFDVVQDAEGLPDCSCDAKGLTTLDRPLNLPRASSYRWSWRRVLAMLLRLKPSLFKSPCSTAISAACRIKGHRLFRAIQIIFRRDCLSSPKLLACPLARSVIRV